jgi:hypothetical protein
MAHYFGFISLNSFQPKGVRTIRVSRHSFRSKRIAVSQSVWSLGILLLAGQTFTPPTNLRWSLTPSSMDVQYSAFVRAEEPSNPPFVGLPSLLST